MTRHTTNFLKKENKTKLFLDFICSTLYRINLLSFIYDTSCLNAASDLKIDSEVKDV